MYIIVCNTTSVPPHFCPVVPTLPENSFLSLLCFFFFLPQRGHPARVGHPQFFQGRAALVFYISLATNPIFTWSGDTGHCFWLPLSLCWIHARRRTPDVIPLVWDGITPHPLSPGDLVGTHAGLLEGIPRCLLHVTSLRQERAEPSRESSGMADQAETHVSLERGGYSPHWRFVSCHSGFKSQPPITGLRHSN